MNLDAKFTKYAFYGFNALYMIGCISMLVFAGIIQYNVYFYTFFPDSLPVPSTLLLITSCVLITVAALGYYGAIRESSWMLYGFAGTLAVVAVIQLAGGCLALSQEYALEVEMEQIMLNKQQMYIDFVKAEEGTDEGAAAKKTWDDLQRESYCCGVYNASEWTVPTALDETPPSCTCKHSGVPCEDNSYTRGCFPFYSNYMHNLEIVLGCLAISFFAFVLFSIGLSQMLAKSAKTTSSIA